METTITAAAGGIASITEGSVGEPAPPGYGFFGHQVVIEMPDAPSAATPNVLHFGIDASVVPPGHDETTVQVFRDGVPVPDCISAPGVADPSPCVSERLALGGGDIGITVLTVQASTWTTGILLPYEFSGFLFPVRNPPRVNVAKGGWVVPVRFSLGGDRGLDIFADGSPTSVRIPCPAQASGEVIGETSGASAFGPWYNPRTDRYIYAWRTQRAWAGTCREFRIEFVDGTVATAIFKFKSRRGGTHRSRRSGPASAVRSAT